MHAAAPAQKFFFDVNSFEDEVDPDPEEFAEPPPPTFSEVELAAARAQAIEQGRAEGREVAEAEAWAREEEAASRALEAVNRSLEMLASSEAARAQRYEREACALALATLEKLFPTLNDAHGLAEVRAVVERVLAAAHGPAQKITVRVAERHVEALSGLSPDIIEVAGDASLGAGDCRAAWADGGAVRDARALATHIAGALRAGLVPEGETEDDASDG